MYNLNYEFMSPIGWRCPQCNRIYSPTTPVCFYCNNKEVKVSTTTTGGDQEWWKKYLEESTTAGEYYIKNISLDKLLRQNYYNEEDLWGKPL